MLNDKDQGRMLSCTPFGNDQPDVKFSVVRLQLFIWTLDAVITEDGVCWVKKEATFPADWQKALDALVHRAWLQEVIRKWGLDPRKLPDFGIVENELGRFPSIKSPVEARVTYCEAIKPSDNNEFILGEAEVELNGWKFDVDIVPHEIRWPGFVNVDSHTVQALEQKILKAWVCERMATWVDRLGIEVLRTTCDGGHPGLKRR